MDMVDDSEIEFDPDVLNKKADERTSNVLSHLSQQTQDELSINNLESTLEQYRQYYPKLELYRRIAEVESQNPPVYVTDIASRYSRIHLEAYDDSDPMEAVHTIPELHQNIITIIEEIEQSKTVGEVPSPLIEIADEMERLAEIYGKLDESTEL